MKTAIKIFALFLVIAITSCNKLLDLEPNDSAIQPSSEALKTAEDLQMVLNSSYDVLTDGNFLGGDYWYFSDLMGDDVDGSLLEGDEATYYTHNTSIFNGASRSMWKNPYFAIYRANTLINEIDKGTVPNLSVAEADRIKAESSFIRAICHFEVNRIFAHQYGYTSDNSHLGVPYRNVDNLKELSLKRSTVKEVYENVIKDLKYAESILPGKNGGYATKWSAKAYLAKVYFQMNDFANAYTYANDVIENGLHDGIIFDEQYIDTLSIPVFHTLKGSNNQDSIALKGIDLVHVFRRFSQFGLSTESAFSLISYNSSNHSGESIQKRYKNVISDLQPEYAASRSLNKVIYDMGVADSLDLRRYLFSKVEKNDITQYRLNKYNHYLYFNVPLAHITELMLIRAESAGELNTNLTVAVSDLNKIRNRVGLGNMSSSSATDIIVEAQNQRRLEMVGEGTRFWDWKRRGALAKSRGLSFNEKIRGASWNCDGMAVQLPDNETAANPEMPLNLQGNCH